MPLLPRLSSLRRYLFHKDRVEQELAEEVQAYLDMLIETKLEQGLTPQEARRQALIELGGVEQVKERVREVRMGHYLETLWQDIRYGTRMLVKNPGFTAVAVLTLALGIGANTAIFSVVNGVLLRSLPYADSDRLHWVTIDRRELGNRFTLSAADFLILKERMQSFEKLAAVTTERLNLTGGPEPERIPAMWVTADFFSALEARPALGRTFLPQEDQPGKPTVAVVSYALWQRYLGSDPNAIGRSLTLNDKSYTVIGIMPPDFKFLRPIDVWPILQLSRPHKRPPYFYWLVGKLKPGISDQQLGAEFEAMHKQVEQEYPDPQPSVWAFMSEPLKQYITGDVRPALLALLVAVGFVLLIATANVANLLLARAATQEREMAIRSALGASRFRLVRQLLTESLLIALAGGGLGLLLAVWGLDLLVALEPGSLPRLNEVSIDKGVLAFTSIVSLLSGVLFGLAPALQSSRTNLNESLKEGGRSSTETRGRRRLRALLVVSQTALALILLAGAGLMVRSFIRLQQVNPGFNPEGVLTMPLSLPKARYPENHKQVSFYRELIERVQALPGVQSASISVSIPPSNVNTTEYFEVEGQPIPAGQNYPLAEETLIGNDYFRTLSIPLLAGRHFEQRDNGDAPPVAIINETMAERYFPDEMAVGKRIRAGGFGADDPWITVVGVVGDVKYNGLAAEKSPTIYLPYEQQPWWISQMYLVLRASSDTSSTIAAVRHEVQSIDKDLPIANVKTGKQLLYEAVGQPRFQTLLIAVFAAVALVLAAVGIYGVISFSVSQRTHEIGVRMALGAQARDVLRLVIAQGMKMALIGVMIGLAGALALMRLMSGLLFGVEATDPLTFMLITLLLTVVALLACWIPARRAAKVDPMVALRQE